VYYLAVSYICFGERFRLVVVLKSRGGRNLARHTDVSGHISVASTVNKQASACREFYVL